ncbi:uncharacterized protein TM35_000411260 [Trypanosoma theileri]|uniref:CRAL-TRIO domain-containing protein n=1 Tax=Trypanosoma theileri TaxID=67003 RepID=A0A1X0NJ96_9TRYP|nr:uncharacterized protein TM35_000411260 [Trypanosoma theileri]ORC84756.1 hypothetical protein TM35_000411260 [Trypanosoma theileri]
MPNATLLDIGVKAYEHQAEVDEVRQRLNIKHHYFDCWIYGFLENKNYDVEETVKKLERRLAFEKEQLANHTVTDWMMESMQKGIMQIIGHDREGRVVFYVVTARDKPTAARREESRMNFDMMVSYGTRLREDNKRCQMVMLINQEKASVWSNVDMTFQADIALRIAKFYPGAVDKMYICNMNRTLAAMAKPIFSRLPAIVSERIIIISESDKNSGKLFEYFDPSVVPVALGGTNGCDQQNNYTQFSVTIKEHFEQLKHAVKHRGLSVKEWELETLFPHGLPEERDSSADCIGTLRSLRSPSALVPAASAAPMDDGKGASVNMDPMWSETSRNSDGAVNVDSVDLLTCDTVDAPYVASKSRERLRSNTMAIFSAAAASSFDGRNIMEDFVDHFFLLESFFRKSIEEASQREWLSFLQREARARHVIHEAEQNMDKNKFIFGFLPSSLQIIARGFLWMVLMVMAFYFFIATLFCAVFCCCLMVGFFFSMLSHPQNVFAYGCPLVVTSCQASMLCSRGFELTRRTYNGKLIDAFSAFGFRALLIQALVYVAAVFSFFVVFCVMATKYDVYTGIRYTLATGWIVSVFIILLYHFLYAFGIANFFGNEKSNRRSSLTVATLYFFLDIDMDNNDTSLRRVALSELTLTSSTVLAAFALGIAYLLNNTYAFLAASVILSFISLFLLVMFINFGHSPSTGGLMISAVLYSCLTWLTIIFTNGAHGWKGDWGISITVLLCIAFITDVIVLLYVWIPLRNTMARRWIFRIAWLWIIVQLLSTVILAFVHNYRLGLFTLFLGIHLLFYGFCVNEGSSVYGVSAIVIGFCIVLLFCVLQGGFTSHAVYSEPASISLLPNYTTTTITSTTIMRTTVVNAISNIPSNSVIPVPPVCLARYSNEIDIVGMSLLAKLSDAISLDTTLVDLHKWFPLFTYVRNFTFSSPSFLQSKVFSYTGTDYNTTVITVGSTSEVIAVMESTVVWVNLLMVSLFSFFTPPSWFTWIAMHLISPYGLSSLLWSSSLQEAQEDINTYINTIINNENNNSVYLVGHSLPGAAALYLAATSPYKVYGIGFVAPVEAIAWSSHQKLSNTILSNRVFSVVPSSSALILRWPWGAVTETVPCEDTPHICDRIDTVAELLYQLCNSGKETIM